MSRREWISSDDIFLAKPNRGNNKIIVHQLCRMVLFYENHILGSTIQMRGKANDLAKNYQFNKRIKKDKLQEKRWLFKESRPEFDALHDKFITPYAMNVDASFCLCLKDGRDQNQLCCLLRHIRNSACHVNFSKKNISSQDYLLLKDFNTKTSPQATMIFKMPVLKLKNFFDDIIENIEKIDSF